MFLYFNKMIVFRKYKKHMNTTNLIKLLLSCIAYFSPISFIIHAVLILILFDFLTGVYASHKTKVKIVSNRFRNTIEKFVFYSVAILLSHVFQVSFADWSNLTMIVGGFIALTELFSIYENISTITKLDILSIVKEYLLNIIEGFKKTK